MRMQSRARSAICLLVGAICAAEGQMVAKVSGATGGRRAMLQGEAPDASPTSSPGVINSTSLLDFQEPIISPEPDGLIPRFFLPANFSATPSNSFRPSNNSSGSGRGTSVFPGFWPLDTKGVTSSSSGSSSSKRQQFGLGTALSNAISTAGHDNDGKPGAGSGVGSKVKDWWPSATAPTSAKGSSSSLRAGSVADLAPRIIGGTNVPKGSAPSTGGSASSLRSSASNSASSSRAVAGTFRIVGGSEVLPGRFPFVASLRDTSGRHFCGGTLIMPRVVMTAAHCLDQSDPGLRRPVVHLGRFYNTRDDDEGITRTQCATSVVHEGWSFTTGRNDIALCVLQARVTTIKPVAVARTTVSDSNTALSVLGWGANREGGTNSETLQMAKVYKMDSQGCNRVYQGRISSDQQLCAGLALGGSDACQGDSGGPLLQVGDSLGSDRQHGIVSWGSGCGLAGRPGVYTDVSYYWPWINDKLQSLLGVQLPDAPTDLTADDLADGLGSSSSPSSSSSGGSSSGQQGPSQSQQSAAFTPSYTPAASSLLTGWVDLLAKLWG